MPEELAGGNGWPRGRSGNLTGLLIGAAIRQLDWEPEGSLCVELPSDQRYRFGQGGETNGAVLKLHNYRVLPASVRAGALGFAEAYMSGDVDCSDLTALFRFFLANRKPFERSGRGWFRSRFVDRLAHLARSNSKAGSRRNIRQHYDLGNDFFAHWLDPEMIYSSGLYTNGATSLEQAQSAKLDLICKLLELSSHHKVLEIGCGWGALSRRIARAHGARATGITLSREQLALARMRAVNEGLEANCSFRLEDYRDVRGTFDKVVAIEMIEAVGETYWPRFFRALGDRLTSGGTAVLQAITIDEAHFETYRRKADFIQRHIFPGGMLPTASVIRREAFAAGLVLDRAENFGQCYARTLREWRRRFEAAWPQIATLGFDNRFRRRWLYYLSYCEAGFLERLIDVGVYRLRKL